MRIDPNPSPTQPLIIWQEQAANRSCRLCCLQTALVRSPNTQGGETFPISILPSNKWYVSLSVSRQASACPTTTDTLARASASSQSPF